MAYFVGTKMMNMSAPSLAIRDTVFAICDSCLLVGLRLMNSRWMLRVYRFAIAMDMMAAGTSAPMAMAAKATPTNQDGNKCRMSAGTAKLFLKVLNPQAYSGRSAMPAAMTNSPTI